MADNYNNESTGILRVWRKRSLRTRIYVILAALVVVPLGVGMVMIWYTLTMERILTRIIEKDLRAFQTAESLEIALVNQKGFVSYYFLDGDPDWLRQLGEYRQIFKEKLGQAAMLSDTPEQKEAISKIKNEYVRYVAAKDKVIDLYLKGEREEGTRLHNQVRGLFFKLLEFCQEYRNIHTENIMNEKRAAQVEAERLRIGLVGAMLTVFSMATLLVFVLIRQILNPVMEITREADREGGLNLPRNEIMALSKSVRGLIEDMDTTHSELEKSREHLLHSEKMAMVGKLAAGMAHSIRNPFTSIKMRLFSLSRSSNMSETQMDDINVISEEIRHIDTIVQNFLEFSRPPRLKKRVISPSRVVDSAIQLLERRLKSYDVEVSVVREKMATEILADPEQLKEVFVNLVVNACEAMKNGGMIVITEEEVRREIGNRRIVIRVGDNGPGIPPVICRKIFQPFYSTKEEGTGLGLSIVSRIIEEHEGTIEVDSKEGRGTTFTIGLPVKETGFEQDSYN